MCSCMPGNVFDPLLRGRFNTAGRSGWQRNGDLLNHDRDVLFQVIRLKL